MAQTKITKSARGEDCAMRLPFVCNFNTETTVLAHFNTIEKGMGIKSKDIHAAYLCSDCHDVIDGRRKHDFTEAELYQAKFDSMVETQLKLINKGLIKTA